MTGPAAEEEEIEGGYTDGKIPRGETGEVIHVGGGLPPSEENANLPVFTPDYAHLLLWEVYGENSLTTTMGRTWTGESRTTFYGSVVGAG